MAMPLLLASASPRRKEILTLLDIPFEVCPAVRESAPAGLPPAERVQALARCKAEEVAAAHPNRLVVGADTMVVLDGRALGKPRDEAEAVEMLLSLQGKTHVVMTGVWVCSPGKCGGFVDAAEVTFYPMTREEAAAYAATGEPLDKAGAYAIQGEGAALVDHYDGSLDTIIGLPTTRLIKEFPDLVNAEAAEC